MSQPSRAGGQPMLTQTSPVLADGTKVADLLSPGTREVQMRVLSDPEVYALEMERIFGKVWLLVGHESEIPQSGDFVVRDMGSDSVIVSRGTSEMDLKSTFIPSIAITLMPLSSKYFA